MPSPFHFRTIAAVVCGFGFASAGVAQDDMQKALEHLFDLGLADTKNATRVEQSGERWRSESESVWLIKDEGGEQWILDGSGRVRRVKAMKFKPANLDAEMAQFAKGLKSKVEYRNFNEGDPRKAVAAGNALIFLAHLQRRGKTEFVRENLPAVLALMPSPLEVIDAAVGNIANAQLATLLDAWIEKGDATAYAADIEALAGKFPRGWSERDAALLLAAKLRDQKSAALADEPDAKDAAALFLAMNTNAAKSLPRGNWLLGTPAEDEPFDDDGNPIAKKEDSAAKADPLKAFFADKRKAATALGKLLGDGRFLRVENGTNESRSYSWSSESKTRAQEIADDYEKLIRPQELGELATSVMSSISPEAVREESEPATKRRAAIAWLKTALAGSDEDIAWEYVRGADSTNDSDFQSGINFLVERGSPEMLKKLQAVFFDPAVWNENSLDEMIAVVEKYLKRAPADAAFEPKLRDTVKRGLALADAERSRYSTSDDSYQKQQAARRTAHLKQFDALFKPAAGIADQLADLEKMDEKEALATLSAMSQSFRKKPLAEIEAPLFIAASKAKSTQVKSMLLQLVAMSGFDGRGKKSEPKPLPHDPQFAEAALALLADETTTPNRWDPTSTPTIGETTAGTIASIHHRTDTEEWQKLYVTMPTFAKKLLHASATALVKGEKPPALPNAANVTADKLKALVAELSALPAEKLREAFDAKSGDEQLAVLTQLEKADWPANFAAARFTVAKQKADAPGLLGDPKLQGRKLDASLIAELRDAAVKALVAGTACQVSIGIEPGFDGVDVHMIKPKRGVSYLPKQLEQMGAPGLSGKPQPLGMAGLGLQSGQDRRGENYQFFVWSDEAVTREWKDKHGKPVEAKGGEEPDPRKFNTNPAKFEQTLQNYLSLKPEFRTGFRIMIYTATITDKPDTSKSTEDEDN